MMLHRHFEKLKALWVRTDMEVKEGEDMLTAQAEEHQAEPKEQPKRRKRKAEDE